MKASELVAKTSFKEVFLFDLSWHLHRASHVFEAKNFNAEIDGQFTPTGHLFGTLKAITSVRERYPECLIVLCKDGFPVRRYELMGNKVTKVNGHYEIEGDKSYKADRAAPPFNLYKDQIALEEMVSILPNCVISYEEEEESDDLMFSLAQLFSAKGSNVYIYSGDNDLLQAINPRVCVVRHLESGRNGMFEIIDEKYVLDNPKFGVLPKQLPIFRAIVGDSSDKIPGVYPRFPRELARLLSAVIVEPEDVLSLDIPAFLKSNSIVGSTALTFTKYINLLIENITTFRMNCDLMRLRVLDCFCYKRRTDRALELIEKYKMYAFKKHLYSIKVLN